MKNAGEDFGALGPPEFDELVYVVALLLPELVRSQIAERDVDLNFGVHHGAVASGQFGAGDPYRVFLYVFSTFDNAPISFVIHFCKLFHY